MTERTPLPKPAEAGFEDTRYREAPSLEKLDDRAWFYDAARGNLHVRVRVAAGEDRIVNLIFP